MLIIIVVYTFDSVAQYHNLSLYHYKIDTSSQYAGVFPLEA